MIRTLEIACVVALLAGFLLLLAQFAPRGLARLVSRVRRSLRALSSPGRSSAIVFFVSLSLSAVYTNIRPHVPTWHDEFSYLYAADTFTEGRLSNPAHPFWKHFETIHIVQQPRAFSKYPPAQGAVLAIGQIVAGRPIVGVWLSIAAACAATCWMLHAWVPRHWALAGGLLVACHPLGMFWGYIYFGGAVAMLGGALLYGGARRLVDRTALKHVVPITAGLLLLATSRPFEGLLAALPVAVLLCWWLLRRPSADHVVSSKAILAALAAGAVVVPAVVGFYNQRTTGNAFVMPYAVHEQTYGVAPLFVWQTPRAEPEYRHRHLREFHTHYAMREYRAMHAGVGYLAVVMQKLGMAWAFFVGIPLSVACLSLPWCLRRRWDLFAAACLVFVVGMQICLATFYLGHYLAPIVPVFAFLVVQGTRQWCHYPWRDRFRGPVFASALGVVFCIGAAVTIRAQLVEKPLDAAVDRERIARKLRETPGKHLVFVRYSRDHDTFSEWVYNRADIDAAKIVWANVLSREENRKLVAHFRDRRVWLVEADTHPAKLMPVSKRRMLEPKQRSDDATRGRFAAAGGSR